MAAVTMERRALYLNKWFVFVLLLCGCTQAREQIFLNVDAVQVSTHGGITSVNNEPFTGNLFSLYPNGDTLFIQGYKNGKEEGTWKQFYPSHKLKERRCFKDGKKEGFYLAFWENGTHKLNYYFSNGEYNGMCREWLSSGRLIKQMNYKNGYEDGQQRAWYDNGKIKSNYTVINGRRYGLLGTKNCRNVSDSVFNIK